MARANCCLLSPGLRDLNSARRNVTERYMLHCDEIFAVCDIGRAITDVGVAEVIALAKRARLSKIGIICTKSDVGTNQFRVTRMAIAAN